MCPACVSVAALAAAGSDLIDSLAARSEISGYHLLRADFDYDFHVTTRTRPIRGGSTCCADPDGVLIGGRLRGSHSSCVRCGARTCSSRGVHRIMPLLIWMSLPG